MAAQLCCLIVLIWYLSGCLKVSIIYSFCCHRCSHPVVVVDVDIQKPDTGYLSVIERPGQLSKSVSRQTSSGTQSPQSPQSPQSSQSPQSPQFSQSSPSPPEYTGYTEPLSEGEDEDMDVAPAKNESERTGLSGAAVEEAIASREKMLKQRKEDGEKISADSKFSSNGGLGVPSELNECEEGSSTGGRPRHQKGHSFSSNFKLRALSISPLAHSSIFDQELKNKLQETQQAQDREEAEDEAIEDFNGAVSGNDRMMVKDWRGKRISVPVRVEPKVYFAAERTFLVSHSHSIPSHVP